jgi:hypothetical protein
MKLLLLPSPTKDKQNKVLIDIAKQRNIKWYPKNKCTPDFVDDDTTTSTSRKSMSHVSITNLNVGVLALQMSLKTLIISLF